MHCKTIEEAIELSDRVAPEHLEVMVKVSSNECVPAATATRGISLVLSFR